MKDDYMDYLEKQFEQLLNIDSTTGLYSEIQNYIINEIGSLGYRISKIHKGGVIVDLGGERETHYMLWGIVTQLVFKCGTLIQMEH